MPAKAYRREPRHLNSAFVRRQVQQRRFLRAFRATGVVGPGMRAAGVTPNTLTYWLSDPSFSVAFEQAQRDFADTFLILLYSQAKKGDPHTLRFLLRGLIPERFGTGEVRRTLVLPHKAESVQREPRKPVSIWEGRQVHPPTVQ